MVKSVRFLLLLIAFVSMQIVAWGQPQERLVQVQVTPDHTNWLYKPGEKVKFKVVVLKCNIPQDNLEVRYEISPKVARTRAASTASSSKLPLPVFTHSVIAANALSTSA